MTPGKRRALAPLLRNPRYELLPLKGVESKLGALPSGATVTVTCSPTLGQEATIALAERLSTRGFQVVPHLAARQVADEAQLAAIVDRLYTAGVWDVFVVGGDPSDRTGGFATGLELLEALDRLDHPFSAIGVPGYPEGHYLADHGTMTAALAAKQTLASYMVTQMCFDAGTICDWLRGVRAQGVGLPCHVGIPGAVDARKLLAVSMRIGIGESVRYLRGNRAAVLRLARIRGYRPDSLVRRLAALVRDGRCDIDGLHVYTFNQVERSARWVEGASARAQSARRPVLVRPSAPRGDKHEKMRIGG